MKGWNDPGFWKIPAFLKPLLVILTILMGYTEVLWASEIRTQNPSQLELSLPLEPAVKRSKSLKSNRNSSKYANKNQNKDINTAAGSSQNLSSIEMEPKWVESFLTPKSAFPLKPLNQSVFIYPSAQNLKNRLEASLENPNLNDPVVLRLASLAILPLLNQLGSESVLKKLRVSKVSGEFLREFQASVMERVKGLRLVLTKEDLSWLDLSKLSNTLKQPGHMPFVPETQWREALKDPAKKEKLKSYFGAAWGDVEQKVTDLLQNESNESIPLTKLLPDHLEKLVGQFSSYRGRNCFGTALSFQDKGIEYFRNINLVRETQHHSSMINNDEFANAVWLGYTPVSSGEISQYGLQFGDLIVFYEKTTFPIYDSLRHAAVHLGGEFYFHKQSKSASSPIEITRWRDLISTWSALTTQLDYKVYRRIPKLPLKKQSVKISIEKLDWTR